MYETLMKDIQEMNLTEEDVVYIFREDGLLWNWYYDIKGFPETFISKLEVSTIGVLMKEVK